MISFQQFFAENAIFIIIPLLVGIVKVIHDLLPSYVFLGGAFLCLGIYVVTNQAQLSKSGGASREDVVKGYEKEFEKLSRKEQRKKNRREVQKEREHNDKLRSIERKAAIALKKQVELKSGGEDEEEPEAKPKVVEEKKSNSKARRLQLDEDSDDYGDEALLRLAAIQKKTR